MPINRELASKTVLVIRITELEQNLFVTQDLTISIESVNEDDILDVLSQYCFFVRTFNVKDNKITLFITDKFESSLDNAELLVNISRAHKLGFTDNEISDIVGIEFIMDGDDYILPLESKLDFSNRMKSFSEDITQSEKKISDEDFQNSIAESFVDALDKEFDKDDEITSNHTLKRKKSETENEDK